MELKILDEAPLWTTYILALLVVGVCIVGTAVSFILVATTSSPSEDSSGNDQKYQSMPVSCIHRSFSPLVFHYVDVLPLSRSGRRF
jgi:hypothetical protein